MSHFSFKNIIHASVAGVALFSLSCGGSGQDGSNGFAPLHPGGMVFKIKFDSAGDPPPTTQLPEAMVVTFLSDSFAETNLGSPYSHIGTTYTLVGNNPNQAKIQIAYNNPSDTSVPTTTAYNAMLTIEFSSPTRGRIIAWVVTQGFGAGKDPMGIASDRSDELANPKMGDVYVSPAQ